MKITVKKSAFLMLLFLIAASGVTFTASSCKAKYGCPANEQIQPKVNRKGDLISRRNKNSGQLFDRKMRKRMRR